MDVTDYEPSALVVCPQCGIHVRAAAEAQPPAPELGMVPASAECPPQSTAYREVACPHCGNAMDVSAFKDGDRVNCPHCEQEVKVGSWLASRRARRKRVLKGPASDWFLPRPDTEPTDDVQVLPPSQKWAVCNCNSCSGRLEFDASKEGMKVPCPHCGMQTVLLVPAASVAQRKDPRVFPGEVAESPVRCPKCHSTQVAANPKGFRLGNAALGGVLLGPLGLFGGFLGSREIRITCLKCGHSFSPGHR